MSTISDCFLINNILIKSRKHYEGVGKYEKYIELYQK
jgi:hypothetical protein